MRLRKMINVLFIFLLFYSCNEPPLTPEELREQAFANDPRAKMTLSMTESGNVKELTIAIDNFDETVAVLAFELIFDPSQLTYTSHSNGKFGSPAFEYTVDTDTTFYSFGFNGSIKGSGDLLKVNFSGSSYKKTTIFLRKIDLLDGSGNLIYIDEEEFYSESICYIKEHPTNGEELYDDYKWTNSYCWNANTYNPQP